MSKEQGSQQGNSQSAALAVSHRAVLVLGMHRSGTSAFTRVLSLLGADLPSALQPPDVGNDLGFWEPAELVVIHDEMLAAAESSWDDYRRLPEAWASGDAAPTFRARMLDVLRKDFSNSEFFVLKDPRVCRFVPLWQKVLGEFAAEPLYAMVYRNPLEVAASLRARNEFGTTFSCLLWLRHVLDAERFSRGGRRAWVSFDAILQNWRPTLTRAASDLGLDLPRLNDPSAAAAIEAYLSPQQRHHRRTLEDLGKDPEVPAWVIRVYEAIERELSHPGSGEAIFDEVSKHLDEMEVILTQLGGGKRAYVVEVAAQKHSAEMHRRVAETLKDQLDASRKQLETLQVETAAVGVAQAESREALNASLAREASTVATLQVVREEFDVVRGTLQTVQEEHRALQEKYHTLEVKHREVATRAQGKEQQQLQTIREREQSLHHFQTVAAIYDRRLNRLRREMTQARVRLGYLSRVSPSEWSATIAAGQGTRAQQKKAVDRFKAVVVASGLFDEAFYLARNTDVAKSGMDGLDHYFEFGWKEQRQPHPLFDAQYYAAQNPDIVAANVNPLVHYLFVGAWEGRDPNALFNGRWYLAQNLDVAVAGLNPLSHYVLYGAAEGRWPSPGFDPTGYLMVNPGESESETNPLVGELRRLEILGRKPHVTQLPPGRRFDGRDKQFFDVFDFVLSNRPISLAPPPEPLNLNHMKISIVIPTFEAGSGGIMTIIRLVQQLEFAGHEVTLLIKPVLEEKRTSREFAELIRRQFLPVQAKVQLLDEVPPDEVRGDALIATDRWTCYPVRALKNFRRRFYLVQDYETQFYPVGSEALLTEDTYYMGFDAICAGPWLAELTNKKFGMRSWFFELASDRRCYYEMPAAKRGNNRIAFYARIATARRAVELGYLAFDILRQRGVDFHVDFFGTDMGRPNLGYSYTNHGVMSSEQLGELYNVATIGLVFSATNYSLIPREMMACGLPVVELDSESSRLSFPDMTAELVRQDPVAIANVLQAMLADPVRREAQSRRGLAFAAKFDWADSGRMVERALKEGLAS